VHPALLVPPVDAESGHDTDWSTLFTHELAHYVRRDHLADLLSALVLVLLPWHPLAWWARNRLALLSEDACDDWALTTNGTDAAGYAESLLRVAVQPRPAFVQAMASNKGHLIRRVQRITSADGFRPQVGRAWSACATLLFTCVVVAAAFAQPGRSANAFDETTSDSSMQRALELAKALSDQRGDEEAVTSLRKELNQIATGFTPGENLLKNGDLANGDGLVPESWALQNESLIQFEWADGIGFDGTRGVHITKSEGKFPYATFVQTINAPRDDCLVRLSAMVKSRNVGKAVLDLVFLNERNEWIYHIWVCSIADSDGEQTIDRDLLHRQSPDETPTAGTTSSAQEADDYVLVSVGPGSWQQYLAYAYVPSGTRKIEVSAQMYWPGELWLDDFELREVKP
jgi:hypothetical protein